MNTKQLQSFVTVAKMHNIAETAKILNYSPSTIHAHLSSLEEELECKLYRRLSSGIVLTELGNQFLPYAEDILAKYNEAMQEAWNNFKSNPDKKLEKEFNYCQ